MNDQPVWQTLLPAAAQQGRLCLVTYDYTESGVTQRCGFICAAPNVRSAAENFWNQHPGEWFRLISVNDGSVEAFWFPKDEKFVTIPEKEDREME